MARIEVEKVKRPEAVRNISRFNVQNVLVRQHNFPIAVYDEDLHGDAYTDRVSWEASERARKLIPSKNGVKMGIERWLREAKPNKFLKFCELMTAEWMGFGDRKLTGHGLSDTRMSAAATRAIG